MFSPELNHGFMLLSHFKSARRKLLKSKIFSMINIFGLAIGITASLLILQYVTFEFSYDTFHKNSSEIYRIVYEEFENGELKNTSARNYVGIRSLIKEHFPEIKCFTGFDFMRANIGIVFRYNRKMYQELGGYIWADSSFFRVFPSLLAQGETSTVLSRPNNIVISEKIAKKVFGASNPIGQEFEDAA